MSEAIRLLHVGTDHPHAQGWRALFDHIDGFEVVAHVTEANGRSDTLCGAHRRKPVYQDLACALSEVACDAALVTLPNNETVSAVEALCAAGKHLVLEKPVAGTAQDMQRITDLVNQAGRVAEVAYTWRCHPVSCEIRKLVAEGYIGKVYLGTFRMLATYVALRGSGHYLFKRSVSTGGYLSWLACHWIDLMLFVLQEPVVAVTGITRTMTSEPIDVEDVGGAVLELGSGAVVTLACGYVLPGGKDLYVGLNGDRGWVHWPDGDDEFEAQSDRMEWAHCPKRAMRFDVDRSGGYGGQMSRTLLANFARRIEGAGEPINPPENNVACLRIIDAIYESSRTGRRVEL